MLSVTPVPAAIGKRFKDCPVSLDPQLQLTADHSFNKKAVLALSRLNQGAVAVAVAGAVSEVPI